MAETISVQMRKILDAYEDRVENAYEVSVSRVSREAVQRLRNTSPKKERFLCAWLEFEKSQVEGERNGRDCSQSDGLPVDALTGERSRDPQ